MAKEFRTKAEIDLGEGFKVECEASGKKVIADEPLSFGGTDLGMNPIELLLSGLGACKCVTSKVIAKKNGLKLDYLAVECIGFFRPMIRQMSEGDIRVNVHKSCALVAQTFMLAMSEAGYDTCPLEGFDSWRVKKALHLPYDTEINMVVTCGIRLPNGVWGDRYRRPFEEQYHKI